MRVLILANGDPPPPHLLRRLAAEHDLLIAVDGAVRAAAQASVTPDIISGDFDSVSPAEARRLFPQALYLPTPDQNFADLEKAIQLARTRGATAITLAGTTGRRIDHTLGSFALLLRCGADIPLTMIGDGSTVRTVSGSAQFYTTPGDIISLISLDGNARVTLSGVQWPLTGEILSPGTRGLSNKAVASEVSVEVQDGTVIVCHLDARWAANI